MDNETLSGLIRAFETRIKDYEDKIQTYQAYIEADYEWLQMLLLKRQGFNN